MTECLYSAAQYLYLFFIISIVISHFCFKIQGKVFKTFSEDSNSDEFHLRLRNEEYNIVVMTPQILLNGLIAGRISITDLTFLVFDECHHTKQKNPYNCIMGFYRKTKFKNSNENGLPQVKRKWNTFLNESFQSIMYIYMC